MGPAATSTRWLGCSPAPPSRGRTRGSARSSPGRRAAGRRVLPQGRYQLMSPGRRHGKPSDAPQAGPTDAAADSLPWCRWCRPGSRQGIWGDTTDVVRETPRMPTSRSTGRRSLLDRIEAYYDAVPRADSRPETLGPLTLFVADRPGFRWYARPSLGADGITVEDVAAVRRRQRALGQPESFEWVAEVTPSLTAAARPAGLAVSALPLMVLDPAAARRPPVPAGVELRLVTPDDDLARIDAVARIGFAVGGTAVGQLGGDPVAVGSHQPLAGVSEVVGVATLPAIRRRGLGAAVTGLLVADALGRG